MKAIPLKYYKYVRLALNFSGWIALGAMNEILSPTLPDLSIRVGADYEVIGRTLSMRVIGNFFVPFLSGLVYDRFPRSREIGLGVIFTLAGLFCIGIPYCREVWALTILLVFQGVTEGSLVTAAQSIIIELFASAAASALQFMHLGWAVGSFFANLIVRPFLAPDLKLSKTKISYPCLEGNNSSNSSGERNLDNSGSRIEYAYLIIGLYGIFIGIVLLAFGFMPKPQQKMINKDSNANAKHSLRDMIGPSQISDGRPVFGLFMLISLCLIYITDVGGYVLFSRYLVTVAIDPCKSFQMTQADATSLKSVITGVFSIGRVVAGVLIGVLLTRNIQPGIVILAASVCMGVFSTLFGFTGLKSRTAFWAFSILYTFFHAPIYGGCTPWFNQYIRVTSTVIAVAVTGSNIGKFAFPWLAGYIFKVYSSQVFLYLYTVIVLVMVLVVVAAFTISIMTGKRPTYTPKESSKNQVDIQGEDDVNKGKVTDENDKAKDENENEVVTKI